MVTRVCVLRSGGQYGPQHVRWLAKQVPGLVCLSDILLDSVPTVPLKRNWPGWWSKIELFSDSISGDLLFFDLDTVVLGGVGELETARRTTLCSDFLRPEYLNSSVMYVAEEDKETVYSKFVEDPVGHMQRCKKWPALWGDQGFIGERLPNAQRWQTLFPGKVVSYRVDCTQGLPAGADVVCFHGKIKPWNVLLPWIPKLEEA